MKRKPQRKLSEARLTKLIRNMEREPPFLEGPLEPDLIMTELCKKLDSERKRQAAGRGE